MIQEQSITHNKIPRLLPWYAHLMGGYALTGFFPWLLIIWQLFCRREKNLARVLFLVNLMLFAVLSLTALKLKLAWYYLLPLANVFNLFWSMTAWLFQRSHFGLAPKRYHLIEWKEWLWPIAIALAIACGASVLLAIPSVIGVRIELLASFDTLSRKLILWDLFKHIPPFLPYGLLLGFWWAGEGSNFSPSYAITYLAGLALFFLAITAVHILFLFLFFKGDLFSGLLEWQVIPKGITGFRHILLEFEKYDILAFLIFPLLLASSPRIRDFWRRAFLFIPIACLCFLPIGFYQSELWQSLNGQIVYEMSSPNPKSRERAAEWAEILLTRYPNHDMWPVVGDYLARHYWEKGAFSTAKRLYGQVAAFSNDSPRWEWIRTVARAALSSKALGASTLSSDISIPQVSYEPYLTQNWMVLLQNIRYWDGPDVLESEILIRLKSLSKSDERIKLSPIPGLAELDDRAESLGYEVLIMPTKADKIRTLIKSGIPVILPIHESFFLLYGIDNNRSLFKCFSYKHLPERFKNEAKGETEEILLLKPEGHGKSAKRLERLKRLAYQEIPFDFMGSSFQMDCAPLMSVVYPLSAIERISRALNITIADLKQESKGYLASLVGLTFLDSAHPIQSIQWAQDSSRLINDPLPFYVAHMAKCLWTTRSKQVKTCLALENHFPQLAAISDFFRLEAVREFLSEAGQRFQTDLAAGRIPWIIRREYRYFLDRSDPADLEQLIHLTKRDVYNNPAYRQGWRQLAELCKWKGDIDAMVSALEGAQAAGPYDDDIALELANGYVQTDSRKFAKKTMAGIDPSKVTYNANYYFCIGVLAEWDGKIGKALKYYHQAIEMRRYVPLYHIRYGKLLLSEGRRDSARKALEWALSIDGHGSIAREASVLLVKMEKRKDYN